MKLFSPAILLVSLILGCAAATPQIENQRPEETKGIDSSAENFRDLITSYLVHYVRLKAGLELKDNEMPQESIELVSSKDSERIILRVDGLELSSLDVLSQPVRAELILELKVINEKGDIRYEGKKAGTHEVLIDAFMGTDAKKRIADLLVKNALKQFVKDPEFKRVMARHKYGTLGSIVSIF